MKSLCLQSTMFLDRTAIEIPPWSLAHSRSRSLSRSRSGSRMKSCSRHRSPLRPCTITWSRDQKLNPRLELEHEHNPNHDSKPHLETGLHKLFQQNNQSLDSQHLIHTALGPCTLALDPWPSAPANSHGHQPWPLAPGPWPQAPGPSIIQIDHSKLHRAWLNSQLGSTGHQCQGVLAQIHSWHLSNQQGADPPRSTDPPLSRAGNSYKLDGEK